MGRTARARQARILVAGLGNLLLQDDGVGVHAARRLREIAPRGVRVVEVGTAVLDALHLLEWADQVLAIDAMEAGSPPGTIYSFEVKDIDAPGLTTSLHELNFLDVLRFLPEADRPKVMVLGVEPRAIDYGMDLSPSLHAALPGIVQIAQQIVGTWRQPSHRDRGTSPNATPP